MNAADPRRREQAAEEAAAWRLRLEADEAQEADWLAFEAWLGAAPYNHAAYDALEQGLIDVEISREAVLALADGPAQVIALRPGVVRRKVVWGAMAAMAASLVFAMIVARQPGPAIAYAAPSDQPCIVQLADGSEIHLNRGAAIEVRFGGGARRIALKRGEASFRVAHDASNPFEVRAGDNIIRDVGTEFNVARNAQNVVVTVREGVVEVAPQNADRTLVHAGYQARLAPGAAAIAPVAPDDAFAWQSGHLVYHNARLSQVIEDLNRYSATPIIPASDAVGGLQFSGVLAIDDSASMLARLQNFLPIHAETKDGRILVKGAD